MRFDANRLAVLAGLPKGGTGLIKESVDEAADLGLFEEEEEAAGDEGHGMMGHMEEEMDDLLGDAMEEDVMNEDMVALIDVMQTLGVEPVCAVRCATNVAPNKRSPATVTEAYGQGRIVDMANARARSLNVKGLDAMDLRTLKPDGSPWNFNRRADRTLAVQLIRGRRPTWLFGTPPPPPLHAILHVECGHQRG